MPCNTMGTVSSPHFVIFPFMSYGHTIPLLYLARLIREHNITVTIITTPANSPSIRNSLKDTDISIIDIPFPENINGVPPGVEITEKLPEISSFVPFAEATKLMQPDFDQFLDKVKPAVSCVISDAFLGWTQESAAKLEIPRLVFFGMSGFAMTMYPALGQERPHAEVSSLDQPLMFKSFPKLKLTRNDFELPFSNPEPPEGAYIDFLMPNFIAMEKSHGMIVNSFYGLESSYIDHWNQNFGPKAWCVGPLCLAKSIDFQSSKTTNYMSWLNEKLARGKQVLYVAFGTQAQVSREQLQEIAKGLVQSKVNFLWVLRSEITDIFKGIEENSDRFEENFDISKGCEEILGGRGLLVKEWVEQMEILKHKSVKGFLSHCGWNSVMESICAKVPMLALPFMAEQHLNARLVVDEIGVGLRIMPRDGGFRGDVSSEEVEKKVRKLMEGEEGEVVRMKVKIIGEDANDAMKKNGSSWNELVQLVEDVCSKQPFKLS